MRIAIAGLHIECCTFSPYLTRADQFLIRRGDQLLEAHPFLAAFDDVSLVPLVHARAIPGGPVEHSFYQSLKEELLAGLRQNGPWDGIFLNMHGAVYVEGLEDAEGDLVAAIRETVGDEPLIAASYDLHGNVSRQIVDNIDILSAYRTAPHIDWRETVERSWAILVDCLRRGIRPYLSFVPVPILLPGEQTSTEWEPGSGLYAFIPELIRDKGLLDASILIGYVWADEPRASASVIALGTDQAVTAESARILAQKLWEVRRQFRFGVTAGPVDECIAWAVRSPEQPVVISDSGDNPTAGGVGDVPYVLERLIAAGATRTVYASIVDPEAVAACVAAGIGTRVGVNLGGKRDAVHGTPLPVTGRVLTITRVPWLTDSLGRGAGTQTIVVLQVEGIKVIVTEARTPFHHLSDFRRLGIEPADSKILVVKVGYLVPELKQLAAAAFLALSPGAVNQNITELTFNRIRRPQYPFDPDMAWQP